MAPQTTKEFDYTEFLHSATQAVYGFALMYILYQLKINELHMEALLLQHKQDVIAHFLGIEYRKNQNDTYVFCNTA